MHRQGDDNATHPYEMLIFCGRSLVSLVLMAVIATASPGDPCDKEDKHCPRAPCPAPQPGCRREANPLVLADDGKCCQRSMCDFYDCPQFQGCQCDGGGPFCDDQSSRDGYYFDCSRSSNGTACSQSIDPDSKPKSQCACLLSACNSHSDMLTNDMVSSCVLACEKPEPWNSICPNYDDQVDWCSYYAVWMCVADTASCKTKPPRNECESKCHAQATGSSPADRLDSFLICLGGCGSRGNRSPAVV